MKKQMFVLAAVMVILAGSVIGSKASSWSQVFNETGVGYFDEMAMFMKTGTALFDGSSGYTNSSWTPTNTPSFVMASGDDVTNIDFRLGFTDSSPFTFDFFALHDGIVLEGAIAAWNGGSWNITSIMPLEVATITYQNDLAASSPVPEPTTMLLFGTGLVGLAGVGRKKFQK